MQLVAKRRLDEGEKFEAIFDQLVKLRGEIARNAGFENYRDYAFRKLGRFELAGGLENDRTVLPLAFTAPGGKPVEVAWRHVDGVTLPRSERRTKRVERSGPQEQAVACGMLALETGELRVACDAILDTRKHLDRSDHGGDGECTRDRGRCDEAQPNRRTPRRTRIALTPSFHVIFFPSA